MLTHEMTIAGLKRALPICRVNDNLYIGAFVIFGDCELTMACATELLKKAPEYDYLITAESKGIPLAYEMARQHGDKKWLLARKGAKLYMQNVVGVEVKSITTAAVQKLYLDGADAALMKGKRVLIVDDVISTGESLHALEALVNQAGAHRPHLPRKAAGVQREGRNHRVNQVNLGSRKELDAVSCSAAFVMQRAPLFSRVYKMKIRRILPQKGGMRMDYRTDLAMERTVRPGGMGAGVSVHTQQQAGAEVTWVRVSSEKAAERLGKAQGLYWTLTHPKLPHMLPEERMDIAREVAQMLRMMLPPQGDVLVLGLGNRRMTADALGDRVVSGILVTRHMQEEHLRSVCAVAPGVLGITGVETAELALGLAERVKPSAVIVVDALAAMETAHIGTTIQLTDTGIRPGSGVGNHRKGITAETMHVPVIAVGIPLVVYASTIVRDALADMMKRESDDAQALAEQLTSGYPRDFVVTPRNIDELVAGLADLLALAINSALQTNLEMEELSHCLH